jgi:hypothetical protein
MASIGLGTKFFWIERKLEDQCYACNFIAVYDAQQLKGNRHRRRLLLSTPYCGKGNLASSFRRSKL